MRVKNNLFQEQYVDKFNSDGLVGFLAYQPL